VGWVDLLDLLDLRALRSAAGPDLDLADWDLLQVAMLKWDQLSTKRGWEVFLGATHFKEI